MNRKSFISVEDSKVLYGIAILFMIFHHCFCIPSRLGYNYIPVLGGFEIESRIAYIGKLCVAIYAFITGYALAVKAKGIQSDNILIRLKTDVSISVRQLWRFYRKFWLVFLIFVPIGIFFFNASYSPVSLIKGFIFGGGGYNGEWWYVLQYIKFLFIFPVVEILVYYLFKRKTRLYTILITVFLLSFVIVFGKALEISLIKSAAVWAINKFYSTYMLIFAVAFLLSRLNVFETIDSKLPHNSLTNIVFIFIFIALIGFRWFCITDPGQNDCDVYLIPFLVFSLVKIFDIGVFKKYVYPWLAFLGKYSTYMWLVHTFWIYYYFQNIVLLPRYSVLIFLWATFISLINAVALDRLQIGLQKVCAKYKSRFLSPKTSQQ